MNEEEAAFELLSRNEVNNISVKVLYRPSNYYKYLEWYNFTPKGNLPLIFEPLTNVTQLVYTSDYTSAQRFIDGGFLTLWHVLNDMCTRSIKKLSPKKESIFQVVFSISDRKVLAYEDIHEIYS